MLNPDTEEMEFLKKYLFGKWRVNKIIRCAVLTTIDPEDAEVFINTELEFTASFIKSDRNGLKNVLQESDDQTSPLFENPYYSVGQHLSEKIDKRAMVKLNHLGFDSEYIYIIEIYTDDNYENMWSLGFLFFDPHTPQRTVIPSNGFYYELTKIY